MALSPMPIFVKIDQTVSAWRGVEFWPFPSTCFVAFKTLSHYRASVWFVGIRYSMRDLLSDFNKYAWPATSDMRQIR